MAKIGASGLEKDLKKDLPGKGPRKGAWKHFDKTMGGDKLNYVSFDFRFSKDSKTWIGKNYKRYWGKTTFFKMWADFVKNYEPVIFFWDDREPETPSWSKKEIYTSNYLFEKFREETWHMLVIRRQIKNPTDEYSFDPEVADPRVVEWMTPAYYAKYGAAELDYESSEEEVWTEAAIARIEKEAKKYLSRVKSNRGAEGSQLRGLALEIYDSIHFVNEFIEDYGREEEDHQFMVTNVEGKPIMAKVYRTVYKKDPDFFENLWEELIREGFAEVAEWALGGYKGKLARSPEFKEALTAWASDWGLLD